MDRFIDLKIEEIDDSLIDHKDRGYYLKFEAVPYKRDGNKIIIATSGISTELVNWAKKEYTDYSFVICRSDQIFAILRKLFIKIDMDDASLGLAKKHPLKSAKNLKISSPALVFLAIISLLCLWNIPLQIILIITNILCVFAIMFKVSLFVIGYLSRLGSKEDAVKIDYRDEDLPIYTILVALYMEHRVVGDLVNAIRAIDYPKDKLDVKLILEEDDLQTIDELKKLNCESFFDIIIIPSSLPKTKAKALNYGVLYAKGEYVVVFDAEDIPDIDQLKKAYHKFKNSSPDIVCVQASLSCHNEEQTIIARMFNLEYIIWFDFIIKALEKLGLPIMLGGTSNHFIKDKLIESGGWDPYNVTEDADLGLRIWSSGYRSCLLQSNTLEEAPISMNTWIKQRSRWIKGYLITYLVHLKNRADLKREIKTLKTCSIELFILANSVFFIINIFNLIACMFVITTQHGDYYALLSVLCRLNLYLTLLAPSFNAILIALYQRRKITDSLVMVIVFPIYLLLHNIAAIRALHQLLTRPFHWDKTPHGFCDKDC